MTRRTLIKVLCNERELRNLVPDEDHSVFKSFTKGFRKFSVSSSPS